jgi:hypothetical protein
MTDNADDHLAEDARKELDKLEPPPPDDRDLPEDVDTGDPTEGE